MEISHIFTLCSYRNVTEELRANNKYCRFMNPIKNLVEGTIFEEKITNRIKSPNPPKGIGLLMALTKNQVINSHLGETNPRIFLQGFFPELRELFVQRSLA